MSYLVSNVYNDICLALTTPACHILLSLSLSLNDIYLLIPVSINNTFYVGFVENSQLKWVVWCVKRIQLVVERSMCVWRSIWGQRLGSVCGKRMAWTADHSVSVVWMSVKTTQGWQFCLGIFAVVHYWSNVTDRTVKRVYRSQLFWRMLLSRIITNTSVFTCLHLMLQWITFALVGQEWVLLLTWV